MNDPEFILLLEQYLDGSITPEGRRALRDAVSADPQRRHLFEEQARQHVRLHAQTSRVDFTESQRVATMVMDVVNKEHPAYFIDLLRHRTLRERWQAILRGLRAPRNSPERQYARFALLRIFGPPSVSLGLVAAVLALFVFLTVPMVMPPGPVQDPVGIELMPPEPAPVVLDPRQTPNTPSAGGGAPGTGFPGPESTVSIVTPPTAIDITPGFREAPESPPDPTVLPPASGPCILPAIRLPGALSGRTEEGRVKILRLTDGSAQTERSVANALHWLKAHQQDDGSWVGQDPAAMTGLALLAYLAHGAVPNSPEFGTTIRKALAYQLTHQDAQGFFSKNSYAHAIATYAICEAFTLTRLISLYEPMEKAVAVIVNGQQVGGGFDYSYAKAQRFDTSVTGWQIQALKAARLARPGLPGVDRALDRAARFLKTEAFARDGGGFVYSGQPGIQAASGATWTMTGVGTLCLQMLGQGDTPQVRAGLKALEKLTFTWPLKTDEKAKVYGAYYVTQAKFQQERKPSWKAWDRAFRTALLSRQKSDGHWEGGDYDQGSHVYTTALCTLMLEVYYRYLPTYEQPTKTGVSATAATEVVNINVR